MKPEDMRSLEIYTSLDSLKKINGWTHKEKDFGVGNQDIFKKDDENIEIIITKYEDHLITSNILTQDSLSSKPKLKDDQIMILSKSLDEHDIQYEINVSQSDIQELLEK